ncbi:hypothetical protein QNE33_004398 [Vibrio alginolyticus]|nr:hypothetical protein [Vibrio alginolyticus]
MSTDDIKLIGIAVTAVASLLSFLGLIYVARKNREHADTLHLKVSRNTELVEELKHEYAQELATVQNELSKQLHKSQKAYDKKLEVLEATYEKLGKIQSLVETYVVPFTKHTESRDPEKLKQASIVFEELREYRLRKAIFFDSDDKLGSSMADIMGALNRMENISESESRETIFDRQKIFQETITPAVNSVREQYQRALV